MARGFVYLAVVLDWFSRRVLSWRLSITMEAAFCVETLEDTLARHGKPEIFNTDQGSQFTGAAFTGVLIKNGIAISMDGKGAWRDNISSSGCGAASNTRRCICGATAASARPALRSANTSLFTIPHHNTHLAMWLKRRGFVGRDAIPRGILGSVVPVRRSIGRLMSRAQRERRPMVRPREDGLPRSLRLPRPAATSWAQSAEASRRCSG